MRLDYNIQVFCSHCGEPRYKTDCKFIPNWGFKCPFCGCKCRNKAVVTKQRYQKLHPYVKQTGKPHQYVKEIKEFAKTERLV